MQVTMFIVHKCNGYILNGEPGNRKLFSLENCFVASSVCTKGTFSSSLNVFTENCNSSFSPIASSSHLSLRTGYSEDIWNCFLNQTLCKFCSSLLCDALEHSCLLNFFGECLFQLPGTLFILFCTVNHFKISIVTHFRPFVDILIVNDDTSSFWIWENLLTTALGKSARCSALPSVVNLSCIFLLRWHCLQQYQKVWMPHLFNTCPDICLDCSLWISEFPISQYWLQLEIDGQQPANHKVCQNKEYQSYYL